MSTAVIKGRNVNQAFSEAFWLLRSTGVVENSRNGEVLVMPGPVVTEYEQPEQRVLFNERRDCNHVFHLIEAIWMFAGRNDASFLLPFNSNYFNYAEDNGEVYGAYGYRWRRAFKRDQILDVITTLKADPNSRQAVMGMWDPTRDLLVDVRDRPCNTHIYFDRRGGMLNMTVCNRSNDVLWGAYGANVVHMSMLQELIAWAVGDPVGVYRQMSNNFHVYLKNTQVQDFLAHPPLVNDLYNNYPQVSIYRLLAPNERPEDFLRDCEVWCLEDCKVNSPFINDVVRPLKEAYIARKNGRDYSGFLNDLPDNLDWKVGFQQWLANRASPPKDPLHVDCGGTAA